MGRMSFSQELKELATASEGRMPRVAGKCYADSRARSRCLPEVLDDSDQLAWFVAVPACETH
jgi:hypothetical protein